MHLQSVYLMLFHTTYCITHFGTAEPSSVISWYRGRNMWQNSIIQHCENINSASVRHYSGTAVFRWYKHSDICWYV